MRPATIHQSLLTPLLFVGVPIEALLAEGLFLLVSFGVFGFSKVLAAYALVVAALLHPALRALTRREPRALRLLAAALDYDRFYPARGTLEPYRPAVPKGCLPRI